MFSKWKKWIDRNELQSVNSPGIYIIAYSQTDISEQEFSWREEIIYIGMTNSIGGLKNRLMQFENTIVGKTGHGGAQRVIHKHPDYVKLKKSLYVSVRPFKCDVTSNSPKDLLIMGQVAQFEYVCFADYVKTYGRLPEFNDKKKSPKK